MAPDHPFSLAFRPGRRPLTYDSRASGQKGSRGTTSAGIAKKPGQQDKDSKTAKKDIHRLLGSALEDTSNAHATDNNIRDGLEPGRVAQDGDKEPTRPFQMVMAFRPKSHIETKSSADVRRNDQVEAQQQEARSRQAKFKHETGEVLSMLSGFKMKKTKRMHHVRKAGIKKRAQFKTTGIDYAKIQRQGKVLIKTNQDKVLPASDFWRADLDSAKDKEAYIAKAVSAAVHLQPSRIKVPSAAAQRRAEQAPQNAQGRAPTHVDRVW